MKKIYVVLLCICLVGCTMKKERKEEQKYQSYQIGDVITFHEETWHVIKESKENEDYVVVLKDKKIEELNGKPFYECPEEYDNHLNCMGHMSNNYEESLPKKYLEETYINILGKENLKEIENKSIRLLTKEEVIALGCVVDEYFICKDVPEWLNDDDMIWTMSKDEERTSLDMVYAFGTLSGPTKTEEMNLDSFGVGSTFCVRPVIHLRKNAILFDK